MTGRWRFWAALSFLVVLHAAAIFPGFVSPYDPAVQARELSFAPPTLVHFHDSVSGWRLRPFVYGLKSNEDGTYTQDLSQVYSLRLFVRGPGNERHLFGADGGGKVLLMGTDRYGRDQFSRLIYGARISLFAGLLATALSLLLGAIVGTASGFFGGWLDDGLMRGAELFMALPWLYLLFTVRAFLPLSIDPTEAFLLVVMIIGLVGWVRPARLVRGIVLSTKERKFVLAARGFGASNFYLLRRHIVPETYGVLLTQATLLIPQFILAEITFSFLGLGVAEPVPSWGNMLADLQHYHVLVTYWWMFWPGVVLAAVFLSYFSLADALEKHVQSATV